MSYKWCAVPKCTNTSIKTPKKLFVSVPKNVQVRRKWLKLSQRGINDIAYSSNIFFCEDHFDMENDMANYYQYKMGFSQRIILKGKVLPSKFHCQKMCDADTSRSTILKRQRISLVKQCEDIHPLITTNDVPVVEACAKGKKAKFLINMNSKVYKWCAVLQCKNTSIATPNKVFVHVPSEKRMRDKWLKLARRNPNDLSMKSRLYFCEDHFDLPNDMINYMEYHVMGSVSQVRMRQGCMPKKFICQPGRATRTSDTKEELYILKKRKMRTQECKEHLEKKTLVTKPPSSKEIESGSSGTLDEEEYVNNDRNQDVLEDLRSSDPSQSKNSFSQTILTIKRKIREDFELLEGQNNGTLSLHTDVDIKHEDLEDIDPYNAACRSPTRESRNETPPVYKPVKTMEVTTIKEEPGSPLSDDPIHSDAADSQELAIQIQLRKKIEMLNENKDILKRLREEIIIFENIHKELLVDIKYLQNMSKKK